MALRRTTDATSEPVTVDEVKADANIIATTHDAKILRYIKSARTVAEKETRRSLMTQIWTKTLDGFPDAIRLDYPPIQSVSSITYVDAAGATQTLDPSLYSVDIKSEPGWIVPAYNTAWPTTLDVINAVEVIYVAGYASAALVPPSVKDFISLMAASRYNNAEAHVLGATVATMPHLDGLLDDHRILVFE